MADDTLQTPHGEQLLQALSKLAVEMQQARTVEGVLALVGERLRRLGLSVSVLEYVDDTYRVRYVNVPAALLESLGVGDPIGMVIPEIPGANLSTLRQSDEPVYFADTTKDAEIAFREHMPEMLPFVKSVLEATGLTRLVLAPIIVQGRRWGALSMGSNQLISDDLSAVSLFALQVGSAIDVAETISRLEQRNQELETVHAIASVRPERDVTQMSHQLFEQVARATDSDAVVLHLLDDQQLDYVVVGDAWNYRGALLESYRRFPRVDFPARPNALRVDQVPVAREQVMEAGFTWLAMVPLTGEAGRPLGLLTLGRRADKGYLPSQLRAAEILGVQVASLVERARLYAQAQLRVRHLSLLFDLVRTGATAREVMPLLEQLSQLLIDRFPADCALVLFARNNRLEQVMYRVRPGAGFPDINPLPGPFPIDGTSFAGRSVLERRTIRGSGPELSKVIRSTADAFNIRHLMVAPLIASGQVLGTVTVVRNGEGAQFTEEDAQLLENATGQVAVLIEHVRLFDDLKKSYDDLERTQTVLVRHERLAALGELAAVMAHEVRNPLGVIFNSLTSLKRLVKHDTDGEMLLRIVGEEADRLNRIVGDLLDFARPYEAEKKPIALEPIIASAVDAATQTVPGHQVKVITELPTELPRFVMDGHLVRQAMVNLVVNAIQAMPRGGVVTVRVTSEHRNGQMMARIDVRDEGVGISPHAAERIFQPFFTTKATGTGLGLAVVKRIVDAHHGEISVRSAMGGGTTFTVTLPGEAAA